MTILGKSYSGVWGDLPEDWLEGLNVPRQVSYTLYTIVKQKLNNYCRQYNCQQQHKLQIIKMNIIEVNGNLGPDKNLISSIPCFQHLMYV